MIEKIEVVKKGRVRRAKLNYMRQRTGKSAKIKARVLTDEQIAAEKAMMETDKAAAALAQEQAVEEPVAETTTEE